MPDSPVGQGGLWPGPAPRFPTLAPDHSDEDDHYFRCPDCGELFAVGTWLKDGNLIECDASPCLGQFYAKLAPPEPPAEPSGTPSRGRSV